MLLSIKSASKELGITPRALYARIYRGEIPIVRLSPRTVKIESDTIASIIEKGRTEAFATRG